MLKANLVSHSSKAPRPAVAGEPRSLWFEMARAGTWPNAVALSVLLLLALRLLLAQKVVDNTSASSNEPVSELSVAEGPAPLHQTSQNDLLSVLSTLEQESDPNRREPMFDRAVALIGIDNTAAALEQLLRAVTPTALELRDRLVRRWAEVDPARAADWSGGVVETAPRTAAMKQVAIAWANSDLEAAAHWVVALPMDQATADASIALSYEAARTNPYMALETAGRLAPSPERDSALVHALNQWVLSDFAAARDWAFSLPPSDLRQQLIATVSTAGANQDGQASAELAAIQLEPGAEQDRAAVSIVQQWAQTSPQGAAAWIEQFPEDLGATAAENLASIWALRDAPAAGHWIASLPEGSFREAATRGAAQVVPGRLSP
jgi:hypothetical protein